MQWAHRAHLINIVSYRGLTYRARRSTESAKAECRLHQWTFFLNLGRWRACCAPAAPGWMMCSAVTLPSSLQRAELWAVGFCCGSCGCVVVKMNPDQLLTHWLLRLVCAVTSAETRWRPHPRRPVQEFPPRNSAPWMTTSTTAWVKTTDQDWCRGGVLLP